MLIVVIADNKDFRKKHFYDLTQGVQESEVVVVDDSLVSVIDLEQYLYPSLFTLSAPIVRMQFMLEGKAADLTAVFTKKLVASPTIFFFEELQMPAPLVTTLKKNGAIVYVAEKKPAGPKKGGDVFAMATAVLAKDKKARWIAYREALKENTIEAMMGIIYWKIRDLMLRASGAERVQYESLYRALLEAHAHAWEGGVSLELLIEKVLLTY